MRPMSGGSIQGRVFNLLTARYKSDPGWFSANWPELAELLASASIPARRALSPFGLTENERRFHIEAIREFLKNDTFASEDAAQALQHCASLLRDNWTFKEIPLVERARLFRTYAGKAHTSFKSTTTIPVGDTEGLQAAHHTSLLRGVVLNMDVNMRLLSITITPRKVREVKSLMSIVGIGRDSATDVARRHDDYLAEVSPHGNS